MYVLPPTASSLPIKTRYLHDAEAIATAKLLKLAATSSELRLNFNGTSTPATVFPVPTPKTASF